MSRNNFVSTGGTVGSADAITTAEILDRDVDDTGWTAVIDRQANNTTSYLFGYGPKDKNLNNSGWSDLDLQDGGANPIEGWIRPRVYRDSSQDELVGEGPKIPLASLRNKVSSSTRDKFLLEQQGPYVSGDLKVPPADGYVVWAVKTTSSYGSGTVSGTNSSADAGLAMSELSI